MLIEVEEVIEGLLANALSIAHIERSCAGGRRATVAHTGLTEGVLRLAGILSEDVKPGVDVRLVIEALRRELVPEPLAPYTTAAKNLN